MPDDSALRTCLLTAWRTNNRVSMRLVQRVPAALWGLPLPGAGRRTVGAVAAHLHNARCMWIKTLGSEHGVTPPARVDFRNAAPREVAAALQQSSAGIEALLELGFASNGRVPPSRGYVWRNLALDVGHVLTYFIAHEAHHRGQIVLVARQTGHRLPAAVTSSLWQWKPNGR